MKNRRVRPIPALLAALTTLAGLPALGQAEAPGVESCPLPPQLIDASRVEPSGVPATVEGTELFRVVNRFHVVRRADGTGGIDESTIPFLMHDLNYGFRNTPFRFVREPGITYLDNDTWYADFPNFASMVPMLDQYYEDGVVNWFLVPQIAGGTAPASIFRGPPWTGGSRGILMTYPATGRPTNIVTPPHEMGHLYGLDHPYETAWGTECTSGSNCTWAGDRICDTPASPIVFSANTTGTGIYFANEPGPCLNDPVFAPNTRLYMDAGWPAGHILRDRFSPEQLEEMIFWQNTYQADLIGPDRPDVLVDCDGNLVDDVDEIESGQKTDRNQDLTPDECQVFPEPDDLLVSGMTVDAFNRPRFYDGDSGDWRGDIWNGLTWAHNLRFGSNGLVYIPRLTLVTRFDVRTARNVDVFVDGVLEGAGVFVDLLFDDSGHLLVLDNSSGSIRRYNGFTGTFMGSFGSVASTGMTSPKYMEYGPDGHILVVGNGAQGNTIQKLNRTSGLTLGSFITPGAGGLASGQGILVRGDEVWVSNAGANNVLVYDENGAFLREHVAPGAGGLSNPHGLKIGPDGHLYVASRGTHSVKRFDGASGAFLGDFVAPASGGSAGFGGLDQPAGLLFCEAGGGIDDLLLSHTGGEAGVTSLTWSEPAPGAPLRRFDTIRSVDPSDFVDVASASCVEGNGQNTSSTDIGTPGPGEVRHFLVRPENVCGPAPAGVSSAGAGRATRDCAGGGPGG